MRNGFTLIELLVVIAVLGILAGGILVAINPLKRIGQANDTKIKNDIGQIAQAMQAYYTFHQSYPNDPGGVYALVTSDDLKTEPKKSDGTSYTVVGSPSGCTTQDSNCTNATISVPLNAPQTPGGSWQWSSVTNQAGEVAVTPTTTPIPTSLPTPTPAPSVTANYTPGFGSPAVIIDGAYAPEGTSWANSTYAVKLNNAGNGNTLIIDFGSTRLVSRVKVQADDNDTYQVDYSINNSSWTSFYSVPYSAGGGLRTRDSGTLSSVTARYIRIYATGGDSAYSVSEVQVF